MPFLALLSAELKHFELLLLKLKLHFHPSQSACGYSLSSVVLIKRIKMEGKTGDQTDPEKEWVLYLRSCPVCLVA